VREPFRTPFRFSAARAAAQPFPARLGEHTDEVLAAIGYDGDQRAALRRSGVIA
jgi:crotonobetainyl-CoA:carnitine CoA-transferase CaiB-like acyl-CoA transferase